MLYARTLSIGEEEILHKLSRSSNTIIHRRARIILESAKGSAVKDVADKVGMHYNSVRPVINGFNEFGIASVYPRLRSGRPRKFDSFTSAKLIELLRYDPVEYGIESGVWTLVAAKEVAERTEIVKSICPESVRKVLKRSGLSWKRVKGWIRPSDPRYEQRKKDLDEAVATVLEHPEYDLEYTDESWFVAQEPGGVKNYQTGSAWSAVGMVKTVPTSSKKGTKTLPLYAGMSAKDRQIRYIFTEKTDTQATIEYLGWRSKESNGRGISRLFIVWDNASFHLSKALKEWLEGHNKTAEQDKRAVIELVPLPNRSPWLNLIEVEFRWLKRRALFCRVHETLDVLRDVICACISQRNWTRAPC